MGVPLREMARELGIQGRTHFMGRVTPEEAVALLHAAAVFVLPSHLRSEAFGLCQIEAMACGLPVVSTDLPTGVPEVNRHGETGLIVPPGDARALAAAIKRLLDDPELRARLGEGGRRRARENYRAELMAQRVSAIYREVLNSDS
jgi:rhamnosyl/mannosyltransferase